MSQPALFSRLILFSNLVLFLSRSQPSLTQDYPFPFKLFCFVRVMGLLKEGRPLNWFESQKFIPEVKKLGIEQFIRSYKANEKRTDELLKWGDEVEYTLVKLDHLRESAMLSLRAPELLYELQHDERHAHPEGSSVEVLWRPEYANWQVEGTPGVPYRVYISDLNLVEKNMKLRRKEIEKLLDEDGENEFVVSFTTFPRLGATDGNGFTDPHTEVFGPIARSLYVSDRVTNPHPRFGTLTRNIRLRRGRKVNISLPIFMDENTSEVHPVLPPEIDFDAIVDKQATEAKTLEFEDDAYDQIADLEGETTETLDLDCMAFGMGSSCLQVTLQGRDIDESRQLYDQLAVLAPLMLALTAAAPAFRGMLVDCDSRWNIIAAMVDDRTEEEIDGGVINKSRYDSIDCYIARNDQLIPDIHNDIPIAINKEAYEKLKSEDIDDLLAQHVAHLFIRDPLVIYDNDFENADDPKLTHHFENIQSTNWNSVRFKPPPPDSKNIGWRTEFRTMEVQLTDFENSAFSIFIVLVSRVILAFGLNLYMPMSEVDKNMATAQERDAARKGLFHFRKNIFRKSSAVPPNGFSCSCGHLHEPTFGFGELKCATDPNATALMTLNQIFNGIHSSESSDGFGFPGFIPLIKGYLGSMEIEDATKKRLSNYLNFIGDRARGDLLTPAQWMRAFIQTHSKYKKDSIISKEILYDLVRAIVAINRGEMHAPELLGNYHSVLDQGDIEANTLRVLREGANSDAKLRGTSLSLSTVMDAMERVAMGDTSL